MKRPGLTDALSETLAVFEEPGTPLTTPEVADGLDLGRRTVYARLERLADQDELDTKKVGANARVWWRPPADDRWEQQFRSLVKATDEYAIFLLDSDGYVLTWNPGAERIKGYNADEIVGDHYSVFYTEADRRAGVPAENLSIAADEGSVEDEGWRVRADGSRFWANVTVSAIRDNGDVVGYAKVTRDMTDRREHEQQLREEKAFVESLLDTPEDLLYAFDTDGEFLRWNSRIPEVTGYPDEEIETLQPLELIADRATGKATAAIEQLIEHGDNVTVELPLVTAEDEEIPYEFTAGPIIGENGEIVGFTGIGRDITERKAREQRLERQLNNLHAELDDVFTRIDDMFFALDDEFRITHINDRTAELVGSPPGELLGAKVWDVFLGSEDDYPRAMFERAVETQQSVEFEYRLEPLDIWSEIRVYPSETGLSVYLLEITDRKRREQKLRDRVRQQHVVAELGQRALDEQDLDALMAEATAAVAETLDNDYCKVLDLDDDADELLLRQGVGWHEGMVGEATVPAVEDDSQAAYTLSTNEPIIVEDLETESQFSGPELLTEHDVRSGISTIIGPTDDPWGILGTHDTETEEYSENDARFVQSVANILAGAIDGQNSKRQLLHQREQLTALNDINVIARAITDAIIDQSTREEIETTACEYLADSASYEFAWIGDVDRTSQTVKPRTEVGTGNYFDEVSISVDPDDEHSEGPTGRALQTGEIQTVQDIRSDPQYEPWRDTAEKYGFRSSAAVPIAYEKTVYGVLNVYADRPAAFEGPERRVLAQLGETIGHAITAAQRKQTLMSDELVELDFRIREPFSNVDAPVELNGTITIDHTVAIGDGKYLVYGTGTSDGLDSLGQFVEHLPDWEELTIHSTGDPRSFELRLSDPPMLSAIASSGAQIDRAILENGDLRVSVHLAPTADVRRVIDVVEGAYPDVEMLRRRQIRRQHDDTQRFSHHTVEQLTERQRNVLEVAYHAGFFNWPRDASGEDIAESLGVAPPTFHQHLRAAEKRILGAVFSSPDAGEE